MKKNLWIFLYILPNLLLAQIESNYEVVYQKKLINPNIKLISDEDFYSTVQNKGLSQETWSIQGNKTFIENEERYLEIDQTVGKINVLSKTSADSIIELNSAYFDENYKLVSIDSSLLSSNMLIYKYKSAFSSTFLVYFLESPKVSSQAMNNYNKYGFSDFVRRTQTLPFRIDVFSSFENFRLHQIKETNKPLKTYNLQTLFLEKVDKFKKQGKSINLSEPKAKPENNFKPDIPKRIDPSKAATMTPDEIKDIKNNKEKPTIAPKNSESKPKIEEKPKPKTEPTNKKTDTEIKNKTENKAVDKPKTEPKELNQPKLDKNQKPDITIKNKEKEIKEFKEKVKETNKEKNNPRNFREINVSEEIKKVKLEKQPIDSKTTQKPAKTETNKNSNKENSPSKLKETSQKEKESKTTPKTDIKKEIKPEKKSNQTKEVKEENKPKSK